MPRRLRRSLSYPSPPPVETLKASTRRRRPSEWVHAAIADLHGELNRLKSFNTDNFALTELVFQLPDEISHEIMLKEDHHLKHGGRMQLGLFFKRVTETQNNVVITDRMWARLLSSTNQPSFLSQKDIDDVKKEEEPATQLLEGDDKRRRKKDGASDKNTDNRSSS